jgi:hypothetical protein
MKRQLLGVAASALLATSALAATDGTLGATSTGTVTLTATVPEPANPTGARISALSDLNFGDYTGTFRSNNSPFCAYHSSPIARLTVSQVGRPTAPFALEGPNNQSIPVILQIAYNGNTVPVQITLSGSYLESVFNRSSQTCAGDQSGFLFWQLPAGNTPGAGTYSAQFQLVLATQ